MFHNRTFKILILILLAVFCTRQAAASTGNENVSPAPALDASVLTCGAVATGVTCADHGSYLDYNININVTGLTGGATAFDIFIGSYLRSTDGGEMGMMSDFVHSETSIDLWNTVLSLVSIWPYSGSGGAGYESFTSGSGFYGEVTNRVNDWRYIGGTSGELHVNGNVDARLSAYSIIGHIYLYSVPVLELTGIEVTQVIQDLNNSVRLIAYKPTFVRAHVRSLIQGATVDNVTAQLSVYRGDVLLDRRRPANLSNGYVDVKNEPDRGELEDSFYFMIPRAWLTGDVMFKIEEVNQPITCAEPDSHGTPNNCEVSVTFEDAPVPVIYYLALNYPEHIPDEHDIKAAKNQIKKALPISNISWHLLTKPYQPSASFDALDAILGQVADDILTKMANPFFGCRNCYNLGILTSDGPGGYSNYKPINHYYGSDGYYYFAVAKQTDHDLNFAHEIAHLTRDPITDPLDPFFGGPKPFHTACKGNNANNSAIPRIPSDGTISEEKSGPNAIYGFDPSLVKQSPSDVLPFLFDENMNLVPAPIVYDPTTCDLMSYALPVWPSKETYDIVFDGLVKKFGYVQTPLPTPVPIPAPTPEIIVTGTIDMSQGTGTLDSIYTLDGNPTIPTTGTYTIRFENAASQEIASYPFEPEVFESGPIAAHLCSASPGMTAPPALPCSIHPA